MTQLKLITPPATIPVSVAEMKEYLRIDNAVEDTGIERMIKAATRKLEAYTGIFFITQTWDVFLDSFVQVSGRKSSPWWSGTKDGAIGDVFGGPGTNILLPIGVAQSLSEFSTYGDDNVAVNETVGNYIVDTVGNRARVGLKVGGVWPQTVLRANNGIRFRLVVGFGEAADVPADIKEAIMEFVAHIYENRGDQEEMKIPAHIEGMVDQYRRYKIGC